MGNELIRELVTGGLDERAARAVDKALDKTTFKFNRQSRSFPAGSYLYPLEPGAAGDFLEITGDLLVLDADHLGLTVTEDALVCIAAAFQVTAAPAMGAVADLWFEITNNPSSDVNVWNPTKYQAVDDLLTGDGNPHFWSVTATITWPMSAGEKIRFDAAVGGISGPTSSTLQAFGFAIRV